ncbi:ADP-ribosylation factor-like protein 16 [Lingula anatina]|uniref:ADP-ribosylation factor-like protein 16 n=1 Tax=Lingula anatina TaxID=7574 RepID=A0A1S3JXV3_LINAN|nr:ADP-ribosylation factor-like protein 16 [Lingula anatina]|eukprot:XP_013414884.1 ADP-ribosylation factor-like protein 16 [Lingula anatina]
MTLQLVSITVIIPVPVLFLCFVRMTLVLGASGVGKTLLLKRLSSCSSKGTYTDLEEPPSTIPTVGTNLVNISMGRKHDITLREMGGCMGPIWKNYFKECSALIFVVDVSNRMQVSASCIQLLEALTNGDVQFVPVLLILNKIDMPNPMTRTELDTTFQLKSILGAAKQDISIIEASAKDGQGLEEIVKWLQQHCKEIVG